MGVIVDSPKSCSPVSNVLVPHLRGHLMRGIKMEVLDKIVLNFVFLL